MIDIIKETKLFFISGGFVMWPLLLNGLFVWYFLILRSFNLHICRKNMTEILERNLITELKKYRRIILTFTASAPLLGLLGTVSGMIETFRSLQYMEFFSQNGGISMGISEALTTTQMGLAIAVPALIFSHFLDAKERATKLLTTNLRMKHE